MAALECMPRANSAVGVCYLGCWRPSHCWWQAGVQNRGQAVRGMCACPSLQAEASILRPSCSRVGMVGTARRTTQLQLQARPCELFMLPLLRLLLIRAVHV